MDANLSLRIATAAVAVPLLVWFVGWSPPWLFSAALFVVMRCGSARIFRHGFSSSSKDQCTGIIFGLALSAIVFFDEPFASVWLGMLFLIAFSAYLFTAGELAERLNRCSSLSLGGIYAGFLFPHWVLLFRQPQGRAWTFWVLSVVMIGEQLPISSAGVLACAKLAPQISPSKNRRRGMGLRGRRHYRRDRRRRISL